MRASHFFEGGSFRDRTAVPVLPEASPLPFWIYFQIRHYINDPRLRTLHARDLTPFDSLCSSTSPQRHLVSNSYSTLYPPKEIRHTWPGRKTFRCNCQKKSGKGLIIILQYCNAGEQLQTPIPVVPDAIKDSQILPTHI